MPQINTNNRHTFTVKYEDVDNPGRYFEGTFTSKRLSFKDKAQLGVRKSQLCGGMYAVMDDEGKPTGQGIEPEVEFINSMIAHLELALVQKPLWFDLNEITDVGLVRHVYERVVDFELKFKSGGGSGDAAAGAGGLGQTDSGQARQGSGAGNVPTPVVGQKVPAALD